MENIYKQQLINKAIELYQEEYESALKVVFEGSSIQKTLTIFYKNEVFVKVIKLNFNKFLDSYRFFSQEIILNTKEIEILGGLQ